MASTPANRQIARSHATWWYSPQRVWLRGAVFQVHLWTGLVLALYAVVIGITGSALVFRPEIQNWLDVRAIHLAPASGSVQWERSVRAIEKERRPWRAVGLEDLNEAGRAPMLLLQRVPPSANYRMVEFNPYTGEVLVDRERYSGFFGFCTNLHFYLLSGVTGLRVSGCMALCLGFLVLTGLVLWWPGVRRWFAALTLRRRNSWQRYNWDLHSVVGFWSALPLLLVTITGIYFAFPTSTRDVILFLTNGHAPVDAIVEQKSHRASLSLNIDEALAAVRRALPADAPVGYMQIPERPDQPYRATGYWRGSLPFSQLVQVAVDRYTGERLSYLDTRKQSFGMRCIQYFFTLHFGSFAGEGILGIVGKALWVLLGLIPTLLAVTALLMYWNRKLRPLFHR